MRYSTGGEERPGIVLGCWLETAVTPSKAWSLLGGCLGAPGLDGAADPKHVPGVTISTGHISFPQAQGGSVLPLGGLCSLPEHSWGKETEEQKG